MNFTALVVDTIDVNVTMPDGTVKTFHLKDDIPVQIGVMVLHEVQKEQDAGNDAGAHLALIDGDVTHICGEIFRHSYPDVTDDEIAGMLQPMDRMDIVMTFFQILTARYKRPPSVTGLPTNPTPAVAAEQATVESQQMGSPSLSNSINGDSDFNSAISLDETSQPNGSSESTSSEPD